MLINANALAIPLANKSVHTIVTSPPYYGLRDYGTAKWEGGDPECEHKGEPMRTKAYINGNTGTGNDVKNADSFQPYKNACGKCGAVRIDEQIGLEVTPDAYIANLVEVFRECKRILRDDGTLWVNIGDSYSGSGNGSGDYRDEGASISKNDAKYGTHKPGTPNGLKPKDLIGIPWMLAFALRADGWYLRQDIIWAKPNPMPESVKDRCTKSHEYIFLLSKSARYYYDSEAIMEVATGYDGRKDTMFKGAVKSYDGVMPGGKPQSFAQNGHERWRYKNLQPDGQQPNTMHLNRLEGEEYMSPVRNKRDVWTVTTKPYKGAHYATFNPDLIKPCILAGAPEGGIVFDPFVGSGTTVATAIQLGRKGIWIDLSFKYLQENAKVRVDAAGLPLLDFIEQ
jgi:DNA modification methylase